MRTHNQIPWDRIVHFYGRGTDIPAAIAQLSDPAPGVRAQAATNLTNYLEHQDGLTQATPFGVQQLLHALATGAVIEKGPALIILQVVANAAIWYLDGHAVQPSLTLADLLAPSRLWPPFESEHQDEILSEEWDPPPEEYLAYHIITAEILIAGASIIQSLLAEGSIRPTAESLLSTIDSLSTQLRNRR